jgi:hypothetical protein
MAEDQEFDVTVPVLSGDERFQDDAEDGVDDRPQHETLLAPNPGVSSESYPVGVLKPHRPADRSSSREFEPSGVREPWRSDQSDVRRSAGLEY